MGPGLEEAGDEGGREGGRKLLPKRARLGGIDWGMQRDLRAVLSLGDLGPPPLVLEALSPLFPPVSPFALISLHCSYATVSLV